MIHHLMRLVSTILVSTLLIGISFIFLVGAKNHTAMPPLMATSALTPNSASPLPCTPNLSLEVMPERTLIVLSSTLTVSVSRLAQEGGCTYAMYELTLQQQGDDAPIFEYNSPQTIGPGVSEPAMFTLTATSTGVITFKAVAYGEYNLCDPETFCWQWAYVEGQSNRVNVLLEVYETYLPIIFKDSK